MQMTERYLAFLAQRLEADTMRLQMFVIAIVCVTTWYTISLLWPSQLSGNGRKVFIVLGVLSYAAIFAISLWTLVDILV